MRGKRWYLQESCGLWSSVRGSLVELRGRRKIRKFQNEINYQKAVQVCQQSRERSTLNTLPLCVTRFTFSASGHVTVSVPISQDDWSRPMAGLDAQRCLTLQKGAHRDLRRSQCALAAPSGLFVNSPSASCLCRWLGAGLHSTSSTKSVRPKTAR
jgi:hypothetical protein